MICFYLSLVSLVSLVGFWMKLRCFVCVVDAFLRRVAVRVSRRSVIFFEFVLVVIV